MSAPEREEGAARPPRRLARSRLFMLVVAVLLVLGIGVRVAVPPAYRWVKAKRARKAAGEAERLLGEGRLEDSARFSRVAYELAPNEAEVLRVGANRGFFWHRTSAHRPRRRGKAHGHAGQLVP